MIFKLANDIYSVFWREMKHFWFQKARVFISVIQPFVWFLLMGSTMNNLTAGMAGAQADPGMTVRRFLDGAPDYMTFVTAGIIAMTALFGGVFGGTSVVWDRRLGYLNKMLAAPIHRASIPLGKMAWIGAQIAIQAGVILGLALIFGVRIATGWWGGLLILAAASLFGMGISGFSLAIGVRSKSMDSLFAVMNLLTMPLLFSSPAMFPAQAMPGWLQAIAAWNPVTYALLPIRTLVYKGWLWPDLMAGAGVLASFAVLTALLAVWQFRRSAG